MEEVDISMEKVAEEEKEEEVEEDTAKEVVGEAAAHMKTEMIYHMSPITLKIQSGSHSQMIQGRGSLRTRCAKSSW